MMRFTPMLALLAVTLSGAPSRGALESRSNALDGLMQRTQRVLEPGRAVLRRIALRVADEAGARTWLLHEARRAGADDREVALVVLEPRELRGAAAVIRQTGSRPIEYWTRAAKKGSPSERSDSLEPVLGVALTAADLGLVEEEPEAFAVIGGRKEGGSPVYEISQRTSSSEPTAKIVNWLHSDDLLPMRREFYSSDGQLVRRESFDQVEMTDGVPTPLSMRITDLRKGRRMRIEVRDLRFETSLPDELFAPERLASLGRHPAWSDLSAPVEELVESGFATVTSSPLRG